MPLVVRLAQHFCSASFILRMGSTLMVTIRTRPQKEVTWQHARHFTTLFFEILNG